MGLKLGRLVVANSPVFVPPLVPAFLVDRINFGLKVLWVGWCPYLSIGVPAWLQEVASLGSISPQLRSPPLILGCLPYFRSLSSLGDAPQYRDQGWSRD